MAVGGRQKGKGLGELEEPWADALQEQPGGTSNWGGLVEAVFLPLLLQLRRRYRIRGRDTSGRRGESCVHHYGWLNLREDGSGPKAIVRFL